MLAIVLAGCGGGGTPKSDPDAVSQVLEDAAKAVAGGDGDKACSYLTPEAQRQVQLQIGRGALGSDCPTLIKRVTLFLTPLDEKQIESMRASNVQVNGTSASATMATQAGAAPGEGMSVQLNLQKVGADWKISGFVNAVGVPGV